MLHKMSNLAYQFYEEIDFRVKHLFWIRLQDYECYCGNFHSEKNFRGFFCLYLFLSLAIKMQN